MRERERELGWRSYKGSGESSVVGQAYDDLHTFHQHMSISAAKILEAQLSESVTIDSYKSNSPKSLSYILHSSAQAKQPNVRSSLLQTTNFIVGSQLIKIQNDRSMSCIKGT